MTHRIPIKLHLTGFLIIKPLFSLILPAFWPFETQLPPLPPTSAIFDHFTSLSLWKNLQKWQFPPVLKIISFLNVEVLFQAIFFIEQI